MEDVRRAGQDGLILLSIIQIEQSQPVRVRVRIYLADLRHDDLVTIPANAACLELVPLAIFNGHRQTCVFNLIHLESRKCQLASDFFHRQTIEVNVVF